MARLRAEVQATLTNPVLHGEPGHYALTGAAPSFDPPDRAGLMLNRTRAALKARPAASEADRADVETALREVDGFLAVMRQHGDEAMRAAALRAIDAALLLGLNHGGGPDFAWRAQAEAEAAGRGQAPAKARASKEASTVRDLLRPLVFAAWKATPDLLKRHKWKATASAVFVQFTREVPAHVRPRSRWLPPPKNATKKHEAYVKRMGNPIRVLAAEYKAAHPTV